MNKVCDLDSPLVPIGKSILEQPKTSEITVATYNIVVAARTMPLLEDFEVTVDKPRIFQKISWSLRKVAHCIYTWFQSITECTFLLKINQFIR